MTLVDDSALTKADHRASSPGSSPKSRIFRVVRSGATNRIGQFVAWSKHVRSTHRHVRPDFAEGATTLVSYIKTHRTKYQRHVGAHLLVQLYKAGPEVLESFAEKHAQQGWHFPLTHEEAEALREAREITSKHTRISHLRYATNVADQIFNKRQFLRMLGLGAAAGSAGILLALTQVFFVAKEATRDMIDEFLGVQIWATAETETSEWVGLAREITEGAVNTDGTLDPTLVADRIEVLVRSLEQAGSTDAAMRYLNHDLVWVLGVLSGIILLVLGRGLLHLVKEGMGGTVSKIEALIADMDAYANWKLGRSPLPPSAGPLPGDLILPAFRPLITDWRQVQQHLREAPPPPPFSRHS